MEAPLAAPVAQRPASGNLATSLANSVASTSDATDEPPDSGEGTLKASTAKSAAAAIAVEAKIESERQQYKESTSTLSESGSDSAIPSGGQALSTDNVAKLSASPLLAKTKPSSAGPQPIPNAGGAHHKGRGNGSNSLHPPSSRDGSSQPSDGRRSSVEGHHAHLPVPPSPSCSVSSVTSVGAGSQSDYDGGGSPSSLSSWNSYVGARRGELADVEDLDLDGGSYMEPELETVSEVGEGEAEGDESSFADASDRPTDGSDADDHAPTPADAATAHRKLRSRFSGIGGSSPGYDAVNGLHHAPILPHFSPKNQGHGLSHLSRYAMRTPSSLAARRRKGRLAELAQLEGGSEVAGTSPAPLASTVMPAPGTAISHSKKGDAKTPGVLPLRRTSTSSTGHEDRSGATTPTIQAAPWNEFEFNGPPAPPVRSISPSETIPAVPSPLCECVITAAPEDPGNNTERENSRDQENSVGPAAVDDSVETIRPTPKAASKPSPLTQDASTPRKDDATDDVDSLSSSPASSRATAASHKTQASSPPTTPASSPAQLTRKTSRGRRASSPTRQKPKAPLRPCFRRRASAQTNASRGSSQRDSSSDRESVTSRGRARVRFSPAPPQELRTHSPVEYDRKPCPMSNRLSHEDVEELRDMKMELGLLEAKWAAMSACKGDTEHTPESPRPLFPTRPWDPNHLAPPRFDPHAGSVGDVPNGPSYAERKRADSIASSSPTTFCKNRFGLDSSHKAWDAPLTPAQHLAKERERERERAMRMAGVGSQTLRLRRDGSTGPPQLHNSNGTAGPQKVAGNNALIARFGLSKPPPPLPGTSTPSSASPSPPIRDDRPIYPQQPTSSYTRGPSADSSTSTITRGRSNSPHDTRAGPALTTLTEDKQLVAHDRSPSDTSSQSTAEEGDASSNSGSRSGRWSTATPSLTHTSPSPSPSPPKKSVQLSSTPWSCGGGYDSPASEFYESGSEYDLIG